MVRDDSWPATVPNVVVISFSFSEAVHTTMYTTRRAVPVECLDPWLFPLIHSLGQLPISVWIGKVPTWKNPKWQNYISDRESDGRFCSGKPGFLFTFNRNLLSFGDIRMWQSDGRMDRLTENMDHYYSWPRHCGQPANNLMPTECALKLQLMLTEVIYCGINSLKTVTRTAALFVSWLFDVIVEL